MHGKRIIFNCGNCGIEVEDLESNRRPNPKSGNWYCSLECAGRGRRKILSLSNGGNGIIRSKPEKDALHYRKNLQKIRGQAGSYYKNNRVNILERKRLVDREVKRQVVEAYGGKCECCGESMIEFLTIDHINGDGFLHRRKVGKGRRIYVDLLKAGCPKDNYRLLCFNCNITRGFYGYCPHHPEDRQELSHVPLNPGRKRTVESLAESKGSPRIDEEDVICMEKTA